MTEPTGGTDPSADNKESVIETRPNHPHLGEDDALRLLEGRLGEIDRAAILAHLETCRECVELYLDAAAEVGFQRIRNIPFRSVRRTKDSAGSGNRERARTVASNSHRDGGVRFSTLARRSGWKLHAAAVAFSTVVVAAALWYGAGALEKSKLSGATAEILQPVQAAVGEFSRVGEIVLPGGEPYIGRSRPVFRSPNGGGNDSLELALKDLLEKFLGGSRSANVAYWLVAGYLSTGDVRTAAVYVAAARERFPDDPRLKVLDATVAYLRMDLARSEALLREVVKDRPDDPLAATAQFDLALVLRDWGRTAEARELLRSVAERRAAGRVGDRARDVAASLDA